MEASYAQHPMPQLWDNPALYFAKISHAPWQILARKCTLSAESRRTADSKDGYRKCEITSKDPEWAFIQRYFEWKKPSNRCIKKVHWCKPPEMTQQFQSTLSHYRKRDQKYGFYA